MPSKPAKSNKKLKITIGFTMTVLFLVFWFFAEDIFQSYLALGSSIIIGSYFSQQYLNQNQQDEQN